MVETYNFKPGFGDELPGAAIANVFIPASTINKKQHLHLVKTIVLENNAIIFLILVDPDDLSFLINTNLHITDEIRGVITFTRQAGINLSGFFK
jgi:hypothetical protein